ncbi:MAG TPA: SDR family oxidoreductase [Candidatus Paceibacterota bacterium]|nr:SDR family oxidoreductase [Candidatus Paceibacterota bacterium]
MKALLTGITGNIGYEVARVFLKEGHTVIPVIRPKEAENPLKKLKNLDADFAKINEYVYADLEQEMPKYSLSGVDCIMHCAGVVHFKKAGNSNEQMMKNLLAFAKDSSIPIYYVSTAYLSKSQNEPLFNEYEKDKKKAEDMLIASYSTHTIFRPSIITGNSKTGKIIHFSGYYLSVPEFVNALKKTDKIRFPSIQNPVNIIPVDWVARSIYNAVKDKKKGTLYITNPNPPTFNALLKETLKFFSLEKKIELVDLTFEGYKKLDLSLAEKELLNFYVPFIPYLTTSYNFPPSLCGHSLSPDYIEKILKYAAKFNNERMEK